MRIIWGALRAVSVETLGILVVLWMVHGATGLAFDAPWRTWSASTAVAATPERDVTSLHVAQLDEPASDPAQRASLRQWFNTLFPASVERDPAPASVADRAEFTQQRLDHYTRMYGIASRD